MNRVGRVMVVLRGVPWLTVIQTTIPWKLSGHCKIISACEALTYTFWGWRDREHAARDDKTRGLPVRHVRGQKSLMLAVKLLISGRARSYLGVSFSILITVLKSLISQNLG